MITKRKLILSILIIISSITLKAQNLMKEPYSYKLKNGITVIIAENTGIGKVYASLDTENEDAIVKEDFSEALDNILNQKAKLVLKATFGESLKAITPSIKFNDNKANVAADIEDFNETLSLMAYTLKNISINENTIVKNSTSKNITAEEVRSFYHQQFDPSKIYITIAGDIKIADAKLLVKKAFGEWENQNFIANK